MPVPCKRKQAKHDPKVIAAAVAEVLQQSGAEAAKSLNEIARSRGIAKQTLSRHVQAARAGKVIGAHGGQGRKLRRSVEKALAHWIAAQNKLHISPTLPKIISKAHQLAALQSRHGQDSAGAATARFTEQWAKRFMRRNGLTFRKPAPVSAAKQRAAASRPAVENFLQQWSAMLQSPFGSTDQTWADNLRRIYNADETGIQRIAKFCKGVALKGQKHAFRVASENKESTVFAMANITGAHVVVAWCCNKYHLVCTCPC